MSVDQYRVERLNKARLHDVATLHRLIYNSRLPNNYFLKKYDTAFTGVECIGFIAYNSDNHPIAYYGVIPCFIQWNDERILSAQSADTMTHPEYRHKGLFVRLAKCTYDLCEENEIRLVFGFPNQNSYKGLIDRLGWTITGKMHRFTIPVSSVSIQSLLARSGWSKRLYSNYRKWILRNVLTNKKGLTSSAIADGCSGVCRDNDYLDYKTYSPTDVIRIGNGTAWIKIKNSLDIGDLDLDNQDLKSTIESLKKIARRTGVTQISFQTSTGTRLCSLFESQFEAVPSFPVGFKDMGAGISLDKIKFTLADIDIF